MHCDDITRSAQVYKKGACKHVIRLKLSEGRCADMTEAWQHDTGNWGYIRPSRSRDAASVADAMGITTDHYTKVKSLQRDVPA